MAKDQPSEVSLALVVLLEYKENEHFILIHFLDETV